MLLSDARCLCDTVLGEHHVQEVGEGTAYRVNISDFARSLDSDSTPSDEHYVLRLLVHLPPVGDMVLHVFGPEREIQRPGPEEPARKNEKSVFHSLFILEHNPSPLPRRPLLDRGRLSHDDLSVSIDK